MKLKERVERAYLPSKRHTIRWDMPAELLEAEVVEEHESFSTHYGHLAVYRLAAGEVVVHVDDRTAGDRVCVDPSSDAKETYFRVRHELDAEATRRWQATMEALKRFREES